MNLIALVAVLLACATSALAQQADPPPFDAAASVQQALTEASAEDLFDAKIDSKSASVRHKASKMMCLWGPNDHVRLFVSPETASLPRGDDVGCSISTPFGYHTIYATRYAADPPVKLLLDVAVASIRQRWPSAKPSSVPPPSGSSALVANRLPPSEARQFTFEEDGKRIVTRVTIARLDGWTYKMRFTGPDVPIDRAGMIWATTMWDVVKQRTAASGMAPS